MNFDELFEKNRYSYKGHDNVLRERGVNEGKFLPPMGDLYSDESESPKFGMVFAALAVLVSSVSILQATFAWLGYKVIQSQGVVDKELPWSWFLGIVFSVNLIRSVDRICFKKK